MLNKTILIVDDEPDLLELLHQVLEMHGYTILAAGSGREALDVWDKKFAQIDLLLTDLTMPEGMTGVMLAGKLQSRKPQLKVVYTSGHSQETAAEIYSMPADANFLKKPFHPDALARIVQDCLNPQDASFDKIRDPM